MLEFLNRIALVLTGALALTIVALLVYSAYLLSEIGRLIKKLPRRPEVERDGAGRPLRERK
jgi:hypothetical protein